jgi:Na+/H+ antiporter NhaC
MIGMMQEHPYGWLSILPPVIAIALAMLTHRIIISLAIGISTGALILAGGNPITAVTTLVNDHLWAKLTNSDTLHICAFTLLMGAMVGIINRAAGMRGLVDAVTPMAKTRERGQFAAWLLGMFVFFDDYANTMLLGNTLRPLMDRLKISREKLAFLVDSTAAPVSGLALVSTWIATELAFVDEGLAKLPTQAKWQAYELFVASIPYRFYVLWILIFVLLVALLGRDFGSMLTAERRAFRGDPANGRDPNDSAESRDPTGPDSSTPARWYNAVIPILVMVFAVLGFLYYSGDPQPNKSLMDIFGDANSYSALLWGSIVGLSLTILLIAPQRIISFAKMQQAAKEGALLMLPALAILWLAQSLSSMTSNGSVDESPAVVANALAEHQVPNEQILKYLASQDVPVDASVAALMQKDKSQYERQEAAAEMNDSAASDRRWQEFQDAFRATATIAVTKDSLRQALLKAGFAEDAVDRALKFAIVDDVKHFRIESPSNESNSNNSTASLHELPIASIVTPVVKLRFTQSESQLYTGDFVSSKLVDLRSTSRWLDAHFVQMLPTLVLIISAVIAFSTGTSWGTMGIVLPMAIPLVYSQLTLNGEVIESSNPILLACVGSVLAGAIFGDHCSPISDTTVLSSQASGCNHMAHVRTQMPYALVVGLLAILFGTLPIGFGWNVWLMLPVGVIVMLAILLMFGKRSDT